MYNFEGLNAQINHSTQLTVEDKKFLALYHEAMTRPNDLVVVNAIDPFMIPFDVLHVTQI